MAETTAAFYCVADDRYFLGAVDMVNSLRLQGHSEPIYLLDCGLTADQRTLLEPEVRLLDAPGGTPPHLLKTVAPLASPARTMVLIDADMIATRSLEPLVTKAAQAGVVAFENARARHVPEWEELLAIGEVREGPYVSSGLVALGGATGTNVLALLHELQPCVDYESTLWRANIGDYPFLYADQDVLNAILHSRVRADELITLPHSLAPTPPFRGLEIVDETSLRCTSAAGEAPYVLHHCLRKPWLDFVHASIYTTLLARLLLADDVAVRVRAEEVPVRLREGVRAQLGRRLVDLKDFGRWRLGDRLPSWLGTRVESVRRRMAGGL